MPYDAKWKTDFENIRKEIKDAVGDLIIGIEHVGSTSVEGLSAKPCIDIDVVIKDYSVFHVVVSRLETIGYIHEGGLCRVHLTWSVPLRPLKQSELPQLFPFFC